MRRAQDLVIDISNCISPYGHSVRTPVRLSFSDK
jgi:hypothetical protein